jgi:hypothetical protein
VRGTKLQYNLPSAREVDEGVGDTNLYISKVKGSHLARRNLLRL